MDILLVVALWVAVAASVVLIDNARIRRRDKNLKDCGEELGFRCEPRAWLFRGTDVRGLTFLDCGPETQALNVMSGEFGGYEMYIFDLPNPSASTFNLRFTTYAAFRSRACPLPIFQITAKDSVERLREKLSSHATLGINDDFARKFALSAGPEAASFFSADKLAHLLHSAEGMCIESSPEWLVVYRRGVKVDRAHLLSFAKETSAIAAILLPLETMDLPAIA